MAVKEIRDGISLVLSIQNSGAIGEVIKDLNESLDIIEASLSDPELDIRSIDLTGKWRPDAGEFDPGDENCLMAWATFAESADAVSFFVGWFTRIENLLGKTETFDAIYESDELQLGEVALSFLALKNKTFLPVYNRFLNLWDLGHSVHVDDTIMYIFKVHGKCK